MITQIRSIDEVLDGIRHSKAHATEYCTNFFPDQGRLQTWIAYGDLSRLAGDRRSTLFLRKDRDFWRLYFCAADFTALREEAEKLMQWITRPVVADLVGRETDSSNIVELLQSVGFRECGSLRRLARAMVLEELPENPGHLLVDEARMPDAMCILHLIEGTFDRHAEQLPTSYEVELAIAQQQILLARRDERIVGLLFFERQGLSSTVRFWVVAPEFQGTGVGASLMTAYFRRQKTVRRFTLWVNKLNTNAIEKYRHYGYVPDGLIDHVLVNGASQP